MKINEKKLRKIIRMQLVLSERFEVDTIAVSDISDCNLTADAGASIKASTVKAANLASKFYGVPGSFCAMIAAATPGISQGPSSRTRNRPFETSSGEETIEETDIDLLSSVKSDLQSARTVYTGRVIAARPEDPQNGGFWAQAKDSYEELVDGRSGIFSSATDPEDMATNIVNDYFLGNGNRRDITKGIRALKSAGKSDVDIIVQLERETAYLMNSHVKLELSYHKGRAVEHSASDTIIQAIDDFRRSTAISD